MSNIIKSNVVFTDYEKLKQHLLRTVSSNEVTTESILVIQLSQSLLTEIQTKYPNSFISVQGESYDAKTQRGFKIRWKVRHTQQLIRLYNFESGQLVKTDTVFYSDREYDIWMETNETVYNCLAIREIVKVE